MTAFAAGDDVLFRPAPFLASVMQIEPPWGDTSSQLNTS